MALVKFTNRPFEGSLNNLVDNLFSDLPGLFTTGFDESMTKVFIPVNVKETEDAYKMEVVAPGFEKSDFQVNVDKNLLTISAERKTEQKEVNEKELRQEYKYRSFKRTFTLHEKIDATGIVAAYINGVLQLNLPKKVEVKPAPTTITIQ